MIEQLLQSAPMPPPPPSPPIDHCTGGCARPIQPDTAVETSTGLFGLSDAATLLLIIVFAMLIATLLTYIHIRVDEKIYR